MEGITFNAGDTFSFFSQTMGKRIKGLANHDTYLINRDKHSLNIMHTRMVLTEKTRKWKV